MDDQLAVALADRFDEYGLRFLEPVELAEIPDQSAIPLTLVHRQGQAEYHVGYADPLTLSSQSWVRPHYIENERLLLLGPRVTERSAEMFRQLGINYLDQAGNAFLTFDGVHFDVRGRRASGNVNASPFRQTRGGVNLFSTKRSQVIFALLSWPALLEGPVRKVAVTAGVSLGQAQITLELLIQYGFLDQRKQFLPGQRDRLLDQWAAAFPTGLGSASKTGRFSGESSRLDPGDSVVYISGEAAVPSFLRQETIVLYTDEFPTELIRTHRWRRDEEHPNIFLRRQFWQPPHATPGPGVYEAPFLLTYAELLASNDGRQQEAARSLREEL